MRHRHPATKDRCCDGDVSRPQDLSEVALEPAQIRWRIVFRQRQEILDRGLSSVRIGPSPTHCASVRRAGRRSSCAASRDPSRTGSRNCGSWRRCSYALRLNVERLQAPDHQRAVAPQRRVREDRQERPHDQLVGRVGLRAVPLQHEAVLVQRRSRTSSKYSLRVERAGAGMTRQDDVRRDHVVLLPRRQQEIAPVVHAQVHVRPLQQIEVDVREERRRRRRRRSRARRRRPRRRGSARRRRAWRRRRGRRRARSAATGCSITGSAPMR